jgi:hypothetical protein
MRPRSPRIDEDEVFAGFRSRLGSQDVLDISARTNLEHDSWLLEEGGRVVAAGGGERHAAEHATFAKPLSYSCACWRGRCRNFGGPLHPLDLSA